MILHRISTQFCGRTQNVTKNVYRTAKKNIFILGVYTMSTAKFYYCDQWGKKLSPATLKLGAWL